MITPSTFTAPAAPPAGERSAVARRIRPVGLAVLAAAVTATLTACGAGYPLAPGPEPAVAPVAATATDAGSAAGAAAAPAGSGAAAQPGGSGHGSPSGGGSGGASGGASGGGSGGTSGGASVGTTGGTSGGASGGATSGGASGGTSGGASGGHPGGPAGPPAPAIASFRVVHEPVCAVHGTPDAPFSTPGSGVTVAWSVTGADGAALAVDDPTTYGAYGSSYPATGQQELPFTCEPGTTTRHTFTVWPAGARGVSRTLTVSARSDG